MTGDLVERLLAALDRHEAGVRPLLTASNWCRQCGGESVEDIEGELRTIQAHRKIIDEHTPHVAPDSFTVLGEAVVVCAKCSDHNGYPDDAPCATLLAVASIYFPEGTE